MPNAVDEAILNKIVDGLSLPQERAVLTRSRFSRIVAGARAGKTEALTRRIVFLTASGVPPESIVAFTFTERAAASMRERIYTRVREILGPDVARGFLDSYAAGLLQPDLVTATTRSSTRTRKWPSYFSTVGSLDSVSPVESGGRNMGSIGRVRWPLTSCDSGLCPAVDKPVNHLVIWGEDELAL